MTTNPPGNDSGTPIHDATAAAEGHEIHPGVTVPSYASGTPVERPMGFDDLEPLDAIPADEQLPAGSTPAGSLTATSGTAGHDDSGSDSSGGKAKADAAKSAASDVAGDAKEKAANVAGTAKEQAANVASEVSDHARQLFGQASGTLKDQASDQQQRAAGGLRTIGDQLGKMAENDDEQGLAAKVVRDLSGRASSFASYLEGREPGTLVEDVKSFAARRPGAFIAIAAGAGILAGRLTKALTTEIKHEKEAEARSTTATSGYDAPTSTTGYDTTGLGTTGTTGFGTTGTTGTGTTGTGPLV
jgi:cell division septum initiation protein DivIVA